MSVKKNASTIQIAQKLTKHLPKEMNDELKTLIQRAEKGDDTTIEIIDLLSPHENIRRWMQEQMSLHNESKSTMRGFHPLAGTPSSIPSNRQWVCPVENCNETFPIIQEGEDAPICDEHDVKMVIKK